MRDVLLQIADCCFDWRHGNIMARDEEHGTDFSSELIAHRRVIYIIYLGKCSACRRSFYDHLFFRRFRRCSFVLYFENSIVKGCWFQDDAVAISGLSMSPDCPHGCDRKFDTYAILEVT